MGLTHLCSSTGTSRSQREIQVRILSIWDDFGASTTSRHRTKTLWPAQMRTPLRRGTVKVVPLGHFCAEGITSVRLVHSAPGPARARIGA